MAHIQMLKKDWKAAKEKLEKVQARKDVPPPVARNIAYRLAYIEEKTYRNRLTGQFSFGLTSQSNVNSGPEDRQVDIFGLPFVLNNSAMPQSDVMARTGLSLDYRHRLGDGDRFFHANVSFVDARYAEFESLNRQDLGLRLGFLLPLENFPLPRARLELHASANRATIDGDHYLDTTGLTASLSAEPTEKTQLRLIAAYIQDDYIASAKRPIADRRDSDKTIVSFVASHALGDGWRLMGGVDYTTVSAKADYNSWSGATLRAGLSKSYHSPIEALPGGWTSAVSVEHSKRDYEAAEIIFSSEPQVTEITRLSFVQTLPLSKKLEAKLALTKSKAASNYSIYSWSDRTASLSVAYKF